MLLIVFVSATLMAGTQGCKFAKNTTPPGVKKPFANVEPGMGLRRSREILGEPDDFATLNRRTGVFGAIFFIPLLVWDLPLWINKTDYVTVFYYQNQGKVIYTRDERVRQVLWDPNEDGYY